MHQELDPHSDPSGRRHVHRLLHPHVVVRALVEDSLQNETVAVGNVRILPVKGDVVCSTCPIPEAQCAATGRHRELLVKGAVPGRLAPPAAEALR